MSRAKKTKSTKEYSRLNIYRHFTEISNHAKKVLLENKAATPPKKKDESE